ncbi:MAG: PD-(D/E)XK nuclease family protein [Bacteroidota bacterium]|nr:PD-(D/E)XK nuclease family protein [Bacteroidota bacterium]
MYLLANRAARQLADKVRSFTTAEGFDSLEFLEQWYSVYPPKPLCYVVPTGRRVRWTMREITRRLYARTHRPLIGFSVMNLAQLAHSLHNRLFPEDDAIVLSDALRLALFERAIEELAAEGHLPFYAPTGKPSWSLVERLAEVVYGLRKDGITPDDLARDLEANTEPFAIDRNRLADIHRVFVRYLHLLGDQYRDETAIFDRCSEALLYRSEPLDHPPIVIEGFSEFRLPERRMVGALAVAGIPTCILLAYSPFNGPLFGNLEETYQSLVSLGYQPWLFDPQDTEQPLWLRPHTAYLRRWLFNTEKEIRNPGFNAAISILGCTNRVEEVTLIAKYVKHCISRDKIPPHRICVAMRDPELYANLFRELFALHGIPANITDRFRLDRSPVAIAVMSVLEVFVRGWRRQDVHRMLANPFIRCTRPDGSALDASVLNAVAERQRITGGHAQGGLQGWHDRLHSSLNHARAYLEMLRAQSYADPIELRDAELDVQQIEQAIQDLEVLTAVLSPPSRQLTATEFCAYVRETILDRLGISASMEETFEQMWNSPKQTPEDIARIELLEKDTRAYAAFLDVLAEIEHAWSIDNTTRKRPLEEYVELLATMLRSSRYQIAEKASYGVTVTSIEQTRGIPYDVYILCGLVDGEFPQAYSTEYFLGKELPASEQRHIRAERIQFYEALTNNPIALEQGTWRMLITYPRLTTNGEQLVRSSFIDKLLKVTTLAERCYLAHELVAQYESSGTLPQGFEWIATLTAPEELWRFEQPNGDTTADWAPTAQVTLDTTAQKAIEPLTCRSYSATELETYVNCPYQYFARHILRLRTPVEYDLALSALENGALLHRIVHRFYRTILDSEGSDNFSTGLRSVRLDPGRREHYADILSQIATSELERLRYSHPLFALEWEQLLGTPQQAGILSQWLDRELERFAEGWEYEPALFELSFGMPSTQGHGVEEPVELSSRLSLHGRIDRLEITKRGTQWHVVVADYKLSSRGSTNTAIRRGEAFQMPLYMLATEKIFQRRYGITPVLDGGVYYIFRPEGEDMSFVAMPANANAYAQKRQRNTSQVVNDYQQQRELLNHALEHAEAVIERIHHGLFTVAPRHPTVCERCDFSSVCRIRQLRDEGVLASR